VAAFAVDALITFACVYWTWRAAVVMWRDSKTSRPAWPWIAVLLVFASAWLCFRPYVMSAGSMENTLLIGDHVLVDTATWSLGRAPRRGDVVVIRYPVDRNQIFTKRVAGIPGDHLRIQNKQLYRNGSPVAEPYAIHKTGYTDSFRDNFPSTPNIHLAATGDDMLQSHVQDGELVVPEGKYFVLGDNRDNSLDSRYWGFITRGDIMGSPFLIYGSVEEGKSPTVLHTRWGRLLKRP
jgi:signal peptidase I